MSDLTIYTRESLEARTVDELQDIAADLEIEGTSNMLKEELVNAIILSVADQALERLLALTALGTTDQAAVVAQLSSRLRALESRVAALDDRTRPSTQLLGTT
jgi:hypothetical protein